MPFCHLWYKNFTSPVVSPVTNYQVVGSTNGGLGQDNLLYPHILSCIPPDSVKHLVPMSESLVDNGCPKNKPSNNLRVFYQTQENEEKQGFAVCSKGLSQLEDVSLKIIEWIELLRSLGVDKISLHILAVHPNVMKVEKMCIKVSKFLDLTFQVFEYYESLGVLEMREITLSGSQPNDPVETNKFLYQRENRNQKHANERLSINDCFLRNMQKYKYIACMDIDEIIVPKNVSNWSEMIELVEGQTKNKEVQQIQIH